MNNDYFDYSDIWPYNPPAVTIILSCNRERVEAHSVEFIDIHEDISGRDVMTFKCSCGEIHESLIYG